MTSRGYPFPCTYCFEPVMKAEYKGLGKYERRHSVDRVIAEILDLKSRWPVEFIKFDDDLFVLRRNDPWLEEFAERYPKEVGIPFNALVRVDSIDEWMAEQLRAAGCTCLTPSRYGIGIFNNMILGLPPETPEQSWSSIQDEKDAIDLEIAAGVTFS